MAEIGCVRYCLDFAHDESLSEEDRAHFPQKGEGLRLPRSRRPRGTTEPDPSVGARWNGKPSCVAPLAAASVATGESENTAPAPQAKPTAKARALPGRRREGDEARGETEEAGACRSTGQLGMYAFLYAVVFVAGSIAGGHALHEGARLLLESGRPIPLLGTRLELVRPLVFAVIGILPMGIVYRLDTLGRALLVSGFGRGDRRGPLVQRKVRSSRFTRTQAIGFPPPPDCSARSWCSESPVGRAAASDRAFADAESVF